MSAADPKFVLRIVGWQTLFAIGTSLLAAASAPRLLLLSGPVEEPTSLVVFLAIAGGGAVAAALTWWNLQRHRFVLRALTLGSRSIEPFDMEALNGEVWSATARWIGASLLMLVFVVAWRPKTMDVATATSVALLAAIIVAAASLPLHVVVRTAFLDAIELADPDVMREVVEEAEQRGAATKLIARRLLAALAMPVAFVACGSALITNAHLRHADERQREETARALARAALESAPGVVATAGLEEAMAVAKRLGFATQVDGVPGEYRVARTATGMTQLTAPLDAGRVVVVFSGSTVPVLSLESLFIIFMAVGSASAVGLVLGRALSDDLRSAARGVQGLTVRSSRQGLAQTARFRAVAELRAAIERLAARFRIFARAQRQAIRAREAATRMRGLFFASVSHDLKSPLNAILGFAELVRQVEPLTEGQVESLTHIERSGRELLALIETVLDAARVEAGQLSLVREPVDARELIDQAIDIGRDLGGRYEVPIAGHIAAGVPLLRVDRVRMARALATFIGQALRSTAGASGVHVRARRFDETHATIEVEVPGASTAAVQLDAILDPIRSSGTTEPRGLALALGLARSVIRLHRGEVRVCGSESAVPVIEVRVPTVGGEEQMVIGD